MVDLKYRDELISGVYKSIRRGSSSNFDYCLTRLWERDRSQFLKNLIIVAAEDVPCYFLWAYQSGMSVMYGSNTSNKYVRKKQFHKARYIGHVLSQASMFKSRMITGLYLLCKEVRRNSDLYFVISNKYDQLEVGKEFQDFIRVYNSQSEWLEKGFSPTYIRSKLKIREGDLLFYDSLVNSIPIFREDARDFIKFSLDVLVELGIHQELAEYKEEYDKSESYFDDIPIDKGIEAAFDGYTRRGRKFVRFIASRLDMSFSKVSLALYLSESSYSQKPLDPHWEVFVSYIIDKKIGKFTYSNLTKDIVSLREEYFGGGKYHE